MTRSVGLFDHVGDDPTNPAVIYQLPPDGIVSIRVLNQGFQDLVNNDLRDGVNSKGKLVFPADGEAYLDALIARNASSSYMSWRELPQERPTMDDDWAMELAAMGGGPDPRNPCPKCGAIPDGPGDGSGRSCAACGWTWMVGMAGGRYKNLNLDRGRQAEPDPHEALRREAASRYRWRVEDAASVADGEARRTLRDLARTLVRGEADPGSIRLSPTLRNLEAWREIEANPTLRSMLVNEYALGLGDVRAPVIVMGTEAADDLTKPVELAYQCIFPLVVLADGRAEVADQLLALGKWKNRASNWRPVHLAPWDYYGKPGSGRNTWRLVAEAVSEAGYEANFGWDRTGMGLGERAYQIERSAASARKVRDGMPPSPERVDFISRTFLPSVAGTARVLLMHGFGSSRRWAAWKERSNQIASAFLGRDAALEFNGVPDLEVRDTDDGRVFIWCRALSTSASGDLISEIRKLIVRAAR